MKIHSLALLCVLGITGATSSVTAGTPPGSFRCEISSAYFAGTDGSLTSSGDGHHGDFLEEDVGATFTVYTASGLIDAGPFETYPWFEREVLDRGRPYERFKMVFRNGTDVYLVRIEPGVQGSGRRFVGLHEGERSIRENARDQPYPVVRFRRADCL